MNKVRFNLKNVHYAKLIESENGVVSYETPVHWPGAVNLDLSADGELSEFYADGVKYYVSSTNDGYSGTLEMALIPDAFRKDILGEVEDETDKVLVEVSDVNPARFALMFEFNGNEKAVRYVLYGVTATRPNIAGATTTATKEPTTESIELDASPVMLGGQLVVKSKTEADTTEAVFNSWYQAVWMPKAGA